MVASESVTEEPWHTVQQDVLLTLDPLNAEEPHAERLLGDGLSSGRRSIPSRNRPIYAEPSAAPSPSERAARRGRITG